MFCWFRCDGILKRRDGANMTRKQTKKEGATKHVPIWPKLKWKRDRLTLLHFFTQWISTIWVSISPTAREKSRSFSRATALDSRTRIHSQLVALQQCQNCRVGGYRVETETSRVQSHTRSIGAWHYDWTYGDWRNRRLRCLTISPLV